MTEDLTGEEMHSERIRREFSARIAENFNLVNRYTVHIMCSDIWKNENIPEVLQHFNKLLTGESGHLQTSSQCVTHKDACFKWTAKLKAKMLLWQIRRFDERVTAKEDYDETVF